MTKSIVIAAAVRTAIGSFNGSLSTLPAAQLATFCIKEALSRAQTSPDEVSETVLGHVLAAAQGQGPARQAAVAAGIPVEKTAYAVNQICGSGLRAVANGFNAIKCGDSSIVVAGGMENMSRAPHAMLLRTGTKFGNAEMIDTMIKDGLWDAFNDYHMGITAENVATKFGITREMQDAFALASQNKAEAAIASGRFKDEIVPVILKGKKGDTVFDTDEGPRAGTTLDALSKLKPAFKKDGGTVTAGNSSGLNDGAAAVVLMGEDDAAKRGLTPLARIVSWATAGVDPAIMGIAPVYATQRALEKAGWNVSELDLIEANEAFAAQSCAVGQELKWDPNKVNVNGGAVALGHPIGASGARVLVTLLYEMQKRQAKKGLATLCIGGGMGIAMCVER